MIAPASETPLPPILVPEECWSETLIAARVKGDSMSNQIKKGDVVFYDYEDKALVDKGIYIVRLNGITAIGRFRSSPDRFEADSSIREYDPIFLGAGVSLEVVGRCTRVTKSLGGGAS